MRSFLPLRLSGGKFRHGLFEFVRLRLCQGYSLRKVDENEANLASYFKRLLIRSIVNRVTEDRMQ